MSCINGVLHRVISEVIELACVHVAHHETRCLISGNIMKLADNDGSAANIGEERDLLRP